jgi:hypothetical protein
MDDAIWVCFAMNDLSEWEPTAAHKTFVKATADCLAHRDLATTALEYWPADNVREVLEKARAALGWLELREETPGDVSISEARRAIDKVLG